MRVLALALLLVGCAPATPPAPAAPTPAAFMFSAEAEGPASLAGGAVVLDPGNACPGEPIRLVGAGLPAGSVSIDANGQVVGPIPLRPDGSFDQRLTLTGPAGGKLVVRHGTQSASFPLSACTPLPAPSASRLPTFTP